MGNPTKRSFEETHEDMVKGLTRTLVHYVKTLQQNGSNEFDQSLALNVSGSGTRQAASDPAPRLGTDANGYPVLPAAACGGTLGKRQLEAVLRTFLSQHYCEYTLNVCMLYSVY